MKPTNLRLYAKRLVEGVNLQKNQILWIYASLDQPEFVRMVVKEAYAKGAKYVKVYWDDSEIDVLTYNSPNKKTIEYLKNIENWEIEKKKQQVIDKPAILHIVSDDPDMFKNILDTNKITEVRSARYKVLKEYIDKLDNEYQWCIGAVPGAAWAKKVFPNLNEEDAIESLWRAILKCSRINEDWKKHSDTLKNNAKKLNDLGITELHYVGDNGTDLRVGMNTNANWLAGDEITKGGVSFSPNIPTEEVFTTPVKGKAEGIIYSSKPLSYKGNIIDKFCIEFKDGKAINGKAEVGEKILLELINEDETAGYLGETAIVERNPITTSGLLFYETLYDENAACHLALGHGFTNTIKGYKNYTTEELHEMGVNDSQIHVDFMVGYPGLKIYAKTQDSNEEILIFENEKIVL